MKKLLSLLLCMVMVVSMLPVPALAAEAEPTAAPTEAPKCICDAKCNEMRNEACPVCASGTAECPWTAPTETPTEVPTEAPTDPVCVCDVRCNEMVNGDCPVCGTGAGECKGKAPVEPTEATTEAPTEPAVVTVSSWTWVDPEGYLADGGLALPGASEDRKATFDVVVAMLPTAIAADGAEIPVTWACPGYPEAGAWEGSYTFTASLPEGYALAEGVPALNVKVTLGDGQTFDIIEGIFLHQETLTLMVEDKFNVNFDFHPLGATCDGITCDSSNEAVATAGLQFNPGDSRGNIEITAVAPGTTDITISADSVTATCEVTVKERPTDVASVNGENYSSLSEAVTNANSGDTVKLLTDWIQKEYIVFDKDLTLDLGEHTLTVQNSYGITVNSGSKLTIATGERGELVSGNDLYTILCSGELKVEGHGISSELVVDGGKILGGTFLDYVGIQAGSAIADGKFTGWVDVSNDSTIASGTFAGEVTSDGTITDGTFTGEVENMGTITGGTFTETSAVTNTSLYSPYIGTISGGTFNGTVTNERDGKITGGSFKEPPVGLPADYQAVKVGDSYTVMPKSVVALVTTDSGTTTYSDVDDAFGAVENGGTIKLLDNVESDGIIELDGPVNLDMNGKTLILTSNYFNIFKTMTVTGGGTVKGSSIDIMEDATLDGGTTTFENECNVYGGTVIGGIFNGQVSLWNALFSSDPGKITGGTFQNVVVKENSIIEGGYFNTITVDTGPLTITDGSFKNEPSAEHMASDKKAVNIPGEEYPWRVVDENAVAMIGDTTYKSLYDAFSAVNENETVDVLANTVVGGATAGVPCTLRLNGHAVTSADEADVLEVCDSLTVDGTLDGNVTVKAGAKLYGGTFTGRVFAENGGNIESGLYKGGIDGTGGTIVNGEFDCPVEHVTIEHGLFRQSVKDSEISGGYFVNVPADSCTYSDGKAPMELSEDHEAYELGYRYTVDTYTVTRTGSAGKVSYYPNLASALQAASDGDTIQLGDNYGDVFTDANPETITVNKNVTVDLNGWMLDVAPKSVISSGKFVDTYVDEYGPGQGYLNCYNTSISGGVFDVKVYSDNSCTISGGEFQKDVWNEGEIKNGTFNAIVKNMGTLSGGTFEGIVYNHQTISGGQFTHTGGNDFDPTDVLNWGTISGGDFGGIVYCSPHVPGNITGGYFQEHGILPEDEDPSTGVAEDQGYKAVETDREGFYWQVVPYFHNCAWYLSEDEQTIYSDECQICHEKFWVTISAEPEYEYDGTAKSAELKFSDNWPESIPKPQITYLRSKTPSTDQVNVGTIEAIITMPKYTQDVVLPAADDPLVAHVSFDIVKKPYTITFETNGGSKINDLTVYSADKVTRPADPVKAGFDFGGWFGDKECTHAWNFDANQIFQDTTLYAKWDRSMFIVTFESNGGSTVRSQVVNNGAKAVKPQDPKREGYAFKGWFTDRACTEAYDFDTPVIGNFTLYAKWAKLNSFALTFDANAGKNKVTNMPEDKYAETEDTEYTFRLSYTKPKRSGHTFTGWNTQEDGKGTKYKAGAKITVKDDVTLYAQWKKVDPTNAKTGDYILGAVAVFALSGAALAAILILKKKKK